MKKSINEDRVRAAPPIPEVLQAVTPVEAEDARHRRVMASAKRVMDKHRSAFAALAK